MCDLSDPKVSYYTSGNCYRTEPFLNECKNFINSLTVPNESKNGGYPSVEIPKVFKFN